MIKEWNGYYYYYDEAFASLSLNILFKFIPKYWIILRFGSELQIAQPLCQDWAREQDLMGAAGWCYYSAVCVFLQMMMVHQPGMGKWKMLPISGNIIICFSAITILNTNYDSPRGIHYRLPHHFPITLAGSQKAAIYQLNVFPFTRPHSKGCTTHSVIGKMCLCGSTSCDECMRSQEMKGECGMAKQTLTYSMPPTRSFVQWSIKVSHHHHQRVRDSNQDNASAGWRGCQFFVVVGDN